MTLPANIIAQSIGIKDCTETALISQLLIDSRDLTYPKESVFFALRTPVNNGHNYIPELIEKGVRFFVVDEDMSHLSGKAVFWRVESVLKALQELAIYVRSLFPSLPVIGITGSRGKTIVKELLYSLLNDYFITVRSPRSYNSQIGVPLSIWELSYETQLAIFEAGISLPGEMDSLRRMIQPSWGVFTSLTDEHAEGFSSMQQKAEEKAKLFIECSDIFYPLGNETVKYAIEKICPDAALHPVDGDNKDMALAVAAEFLASKGIKTKDEALIEKVEAISDKISPRIDVCESLKNCSIIYDGYTNDLRSISDAVNFMMRRLGNGQKAAVILQKLADWSASAEKHLKNYLKAKKVTRIIAVGFPEGIFDDEALDVTQCASAQEFIDHCSISDFNNEAILVKGDAGSGFEDIKSHLEAPRHETIMEVDLGAIVKNFNFYKSKVKPSTGIVAMVKADGYGVGAIHLAKTLQSQGARYLAVAVIDEGVDLRRSGITMPIMVMNPIGTNYKALFDNHIEPSVFSMRELRLLLENAKRLGVKDYPVHIKLDTGMHRLGFLEEELPELISLLKSQDNLKACSIFSHLATADCLDQNEYTEAQLASFERMSTKIMDNFDYKILRHILNTAGIHRYPQYQYDMVRLGIGLYGVSPIPLENEKLAVVARLFSTIISIKKWDEGATIGYGRRGVVSKPSVIATVAIGYADGLDRHLSNGNVKFIVNGVECPVIGNICMDQCMLDVTDANAQIGDKVEIFGENAPLQRLSDTLTTIPYEILTSVSQRVKRIYYRE